MYFANRFYVITTYLMPKNASFKKTSKKSRGYGKSGYKRSFKRYGRSSKPAGATWKKNVKYTRSKYANYAPSVKKRTINKFVKRENLGVSKYTAVRPQSFLDTSAAYNQQETAVLYLTGCPSDMSGALSRYVSKTGAQTAVKALRVMGQEGKLEFAYAPFNLAQNSGETDIACNAYVDVYIFAARKDISNVEYGSTVTTLFDLFSVSYTGGTNDESTSDLLAPNFTPFMNVGWCRQWKCIRKESFRLCPEHPTHFIYHKNPASGRIDKQEDLASLYLAFKGLTTVAVVMWRGALGLNNGGTAGTNLGKPTYGKPPQLGAMQTTTVNYVIDETFTDENYYISALTNPSLDQQVMGEDVSNALKYMS